MELAPKLEDSSSNLNKKHSTESLSNLMHQWILPQLNHLVRMFELLPQTMTQISPNPISNLDDLLEEYKHNQTIPNPFVLLAWSKLMRACFVDQPNSFDLGTNSGSTNENLILDLTQKPNCLTHPNPDVLDSNAGLFFETDHQCSDMSHWFFKLGKKALLHLNESNQVLDPNTWDSTSNLVNSCLSNPKEVQVGFASKSESAEFQSYVDSPRCFSNLATTTPSFNETYHYPGQDGWIDKYWEHQNDMLSCCPLNNNSIELFHNKNGNITNNDCLNKDMMMMMSPSISQGTLLTSARPSLATTQIAVQPPPPPQSFSPPLNFGAFTLDQNMICPICRKCFRFEKNLLRHLQKTHATGTGESVLKCKLCNYTTRHYSNMYVHIRTHTGDKPYSCSACGVSFTQGSSLKLHIKSRHNDNGNYFSLTRKPGKNNLTKLWTRVLKKDLPKFNSMKNHTLGINLNTSNESCWNEWQVGTPIPNSMTMMMTMMMMKQQTPPPTRTSNISHLSNFMTNSTDSLDDSYQISSCRTKFSLDSSIPGEASHSDQWNNKTPQLATSTSPSSRTSHPSFVLSGSMKQRKSGTLSNSVCHRGMLPWRHLNQTKKLDRNLIKCQRLSSNNLSLSQNDSFKQNLLANNVEKTLEDQNHEKEPQEMENITEGQISIKQECCNNYDSELYSKISKDSNFFNFDPFNINDNLLPNLTSDLKENISQTKVNMNSEKLLPFSIAAIQPR